jgi:hypothetical protein
MQKRLWRILKMFRFVAPLTFFGFISWIIYIADTQKHHIIFVWTKSIPYGDKVGHVMLYGMLALLLNYALRFKTIRLLGFNMQIGALAVLTFASIEELTQYYFPYRTVDIYDIYADIVGVVLFSLSYNVYNYTRSYYGNKI